MQAESDRKAGAGPGSKRMLAFDPEVIQHVLSHRADHAASKFLKKEFKLPKKPTSGTNSSLLDSFSGAQSSLFGKVKNPFAKR